MLPPDSPARTRPQDPTLDRMFERVYQDLRRLAHHLRVRGPHASLRTTSLVHEAYLKLARSSATRWRDERHFIRLATAAMRQLLMDEAVARRALKRGGDAVPHTLPGNLPARSIDVDALLDLDRALDRLARIDQRAAQVVELRFFAGLSVEETARVLDVSTPTVKRDWRMARAWIQAEMGRP